MYCTFSCARALASAFLFWNTWRRWPACDLAFPPLNAAWITVAASGRLSFTAAVELVPSSSGAVENRDKDGREEAGGAVDVEEEEFLTEFWWAALLVLVLSPCCCCCPHRLARRASTSSRLCLRSRASLLAALPRPTAFKVCALGVHKIMGKTEINLGG